MKIELIGYAIAGIYLTALGGAIIECLIKQKRKREKDLRARK